MKTPKKRYIRSVSLECFKLFLLIFIFSCSKKVKKQYEPNPDLELLIKNEWDSFFNPVWSPDGKYIYYLRAHRDNLPTRAGELGIGGELWKINLDTRDKKFLLKGPFCSLAISPDGSLLALSYEIDDYELEFEGGPLILVDTSGNILDTLPTSLPLILDVEFNSDGSKLYYYAYDTLTTQIPFGFYRINLDGTGEELVKEMEHNWRIDFGLDHRDSIYIGKYNFNSVKVNYAVVTGYPRFENFSEIYIIDFSSGDTIIPDADPYGPPEEYSGFESAYWSPDGEELVISVGKVYAGDVSYIGNLELWILHKVW